MSIVLLLLVALVAVSAQSDTNVTLSSSGTFVYDNVTQIIEEDISEAQTIYNMFKSVNPYQVGFVVLMSLITAALTYVIKKYGPACRQQQALSETELASITSTLQERTTPPVAPIKV